MEPKSISDGLFWGLKSSHHGGNVNTRGQVDNLRQISDSGSAGDTENHSNFNYELVPGMEAQLRECSQEYYNNFVGWQMVTTLW